MNKISIDNGNKTLNSPEEPYIKPKQSANSLFKFVRKPEHLDFILKNMAIIPRYNIEDIKYLNIGMNEIAYPMVCFCDLNLHRISPHIDFYGCYGIAFSKEWGIKNRFQPLQYINPNSDLVSDYSEAFRFAIKDTSDSEILQNYIQTQMYFLKPISGQMNVNGDIKIKNFTDECEWRYIPNLNETDFPGAITEDNFYSIGRLNSALTKEQRSWIKFEPEDIKYIIIKTHDELQNIISIFKSNNLEDDQIYNLVSKIIIWTDAEEDF